MGWAMRVARSGRVRGREQEETRVEEVNATTPQAFGRSEWGNISLLSAVMKSRTSNKNVAGFNSDPQEGTKRGFSLLASLRVHRLFRCGLASLS